MDTNQWPTPSWITVAVTDACPVACAAMVPRRMSPELAGTEYVIVPVVMPDDPEVIAIHGTSASAVQPHAEVVVMVAVNVPPPLGTGCTVGELVSGVIPLVYAASSPLPHDLTAKRPTVAWASGPHQTPV